MSRGQVALAALLLSTTAAAIALSVGLASGEAIAERPNPVLRWNGTADSLETAIRQLNGLRLVFVKRVNFGRPGEFFGYTSYLKRPPAELCAMEFTGG